MAIVFHCRRRVRRPAASHVGTAGDREMVMEDKPVGAALAEARASRLALNPPGCPAGPVDDARAWVRR
jgi:hypothetical protein